MPEGPEVRKYADALDEVLSGRVILSFAARTKEARKWLEQNEPRLIGRRVERVVSHGKHLIGYIDGGFFFHSHLMMWGHWQTFAAAQRGARKSKSQVTDFLRNCLSPTSKNTTSKISKPSSTARIGR